MRHEEESEQTDASTPPSPHAADVLHAFAAQSVPPSDIIRMTELQAAMCVFFQA